jgi:hypothetical protein
MRRVRTLKTGDLVGPLGLTAKQERELFSRMARSDLIAKARRGLYLVPSRLPLAARWTPDAALVLNTLIADPGGRYHADLVRVTLRYGNARTIRRVGALLEGKGASRRLLDRLAEGFPPPRTIIPFVPGAPRTGRILSRWGVQLNARP